MRSMVRQRCRAAAAGWGVVHRGAGCGFFAPAKGLGRHIISGLQAKSHLSKRVAPPRSAVGRLAAGAIAFAVLAGCRPGAPASDAASRGSQVGADAAAPGQSPVRPQEALPCAHPERAAITHATAAGPMTIDCVPGRAWSSGPSEFNGGVAPTWLRLNGKMILEDSSISTELVKRKGGFEYWLVYAGFHGNACDSWFLLAIGATGHRLYDDLHQCAAWDEVEPNLTFAGLLVRDDSPAVHPQCEPYIKSVPPRIKVRSVELSPKLYKYAFDEREEWLKRVPTRFHPSNWMPFGCIINDYDGAVVAFPAPDGRAGFGLYLEQAALEKLGGMRTEVKP